MLDDGYDAPFQVGSAIPADSKAKAKPREFPMGFHSPPGVEVPR